jgi:hypothetical protein
VFQRFDKRKKLLHNLASVLMKFFSKNVVKTSNKKTRAAKHAAPATKAVSKAVI